MQDWLNHEGFIDYAVIDHQHDMHAHGVTHAPWAYTLIFGRPVGGAKFLKIAPTAVADMPIRIGIYEYFGHSVVVYHTMSSLLAEHAETLRSEGILIDQTIDRMCEIVGAVKSPCVTA